MKEAIMERIKEVIIEKYDIYGDKIESKILELKEKVSEYEYSRDCEELNGILIEKSKLLDSIQQNVEYKTTNEVKKIIKQVELIKNEMENSISIQINKLNQDNLNINYNLIVTKINHKIYSLNNLLSKLIFLEELNDASFWIKQHATLFNSNVVVENENNIIDEDACLKLFKKFNTLKVSVEAFSTQLDSIFDKKNKLIINDDGDDDTSVDDEIKRVKDEYCGQLLFIYLKKKFYGN
jgi:hypothetical protein